MKKLLILLPGFVLHCLISYAQSVIISVDASLPDASAMLEVKSTSKGLLIPRIALTGTNDVVTISSPAVSLILYNTATAGGGSTAVTPGFYYWNGTAWDRLANGSVISGSGTANNIPKFTSTTALGNSVLFETGGNIGVGTVSPLQKLHVAGDINIDAAGGIRISNTAASGQFLRGNGTRFVSSLIQAGDLPSGSTNYIQNQVAANQSAGFRITGNGLFNGGNVGIGTISPFDLLDVARDGSADLGSHFGWNKMVLTNLHNMGVSNNAGHSLGSLILFRGYKDAALSSPQNIYSMGIDVFANTFNSVEKNNFFIRDEYAAGTPVRMLIDATGNIGIGTTSPVHPLQMASGAHVTAGGVWTNASSREFKEEIETLEVEEALMALSGLEPIKFRYKKDKEEKYLGFIAEDVPDLVATKDRKGLSAMDIVAVLTRVVQYQQKKIEALETQLNNRQ